MGTKANPGRFDCHAKAETSAQAGEADSAQDGLRRPNAPLHEGGTDEPLFTLLGRDPAAPMLVRLWAQMRRQADLTGADKEKIAEAKTCAEAMADYCRVTAERVPMKADEALMAAIILAVGDLGIQVNAVAGIATHDLASMTQAVDRLNDTMRRLEGLLLTR